MARMMAEMSASLWRLNFHHMSFHCEARNTRFCCSLIVSVVVGSKGAVET
jgi:hypothetical protein